MNLIEIRNSKGQAYSYAGVGLVMLLAKAVIPDFAGELFSLGGAFGGLLLAFGAYQLFDQRTQLEISEYGFTDRRSSHGTIPWDAIRGARADKGVKSLFISLETNPQAWGGPESIHVRAQGLDVSPEHLANLLNQRAKAEAISNGT